MAKIEDPAQRIRALEREAVQVALENMSGFPFVHQAVAAESLSLHALFFDIGEGRLEEWSEAEDRFVAI